MHLTHFMHTPQLTKHNLMPLYSIWSVSFFLLNPSSKHIYNKKNFYESVHLSFKKYNKVWNKLTLAGAILYFLHQVYISAIPLVSVKLLMICIIWRRILGFSKMLGPHHHAIWAFHNDYAFILATHHEAEKFYYPFCTDGQLEQRQSKWLVWDYTGSLQESRGLKHVSHLSHWIIISLQQKQKRLCSKLQLLVNIKYRWASMKMPGLK